MIFQHTIEHVIAGTKVQTSRIWKDNYSPSFVSAQSDAISAVYTHHQKQPFNRVQYRVGQELSVQAARGTKGIARIRILELAKRDVRDFTNEDIQREGFSPTRQGFDLFYCTWISMHEKTLHRSLLNKTGVSYSHAVGGRPAQFYQALVIRFELVVEQKAAA